MRKRRERNTTISKTNFAHRQSKRQFNEQIHHTSNLWLVPVLIIGSVILFIIIYLTKYNDDLVRLGLTPSGNSTPQTPPEKSGGWKTAEREIIEQYSSDICNIERRWTDELSDSEFENVYRHKKPVILVFRNGSRDWTDPDKWTVESLKKEYGKWSVFSGNAREIVRRGGSGYVHTSFTEYVDTLMSAHDQIGEPYYVFDRDFYKDSSLPHTLKPPNFLKIQNAVDDSIFFLGSSGSGVSFHKHADAWNGVVFGQKRWFLYLVDKTPPGGVYPGFTQTEWLKKIYPKLPDSNKPLECIQNAGEILYLPESTYHGTINLGDTIAIGIQKKQAVTEIEQLFYKDKELVDGLRRRNPVERQTVLKKKQEVVEKLLSLLPTNSEVLMKAGEMYKEIRDLQNARKYTQKALELDEYFLIAVLNLARIEQELGNMDAAENLFLRAMTLNPSLWDVYAQYGDYLLTNGRYKDAVNIYKQGIQIEPKMTAFWVQLKYAQLQAGDKEGANETQKVILQLKAAEKQP